MLGSSRPPKGVLHRASNSAWMMLRSGHRMLGRRRPDGAQQNTEFLIVTMPPKCCLPQEMTDSASQGCGMLEGGVPKEAFEPTRYGLRHGVLNHGCGAQLGSQRVLLEWGGVSGRIVAASAEPHTRREWLPAPKIIPSKRSVLPLMTASLRFALRFPAGQRARDVFGGTCSALWAVAQAAP